MNNTPHLPARWPRLRRDRNHGGLYAEFGTLRLEVAEQAGEHSATITVILAIGTPEHPIRVRGWAVGVVRDRTRREAVLHAGKAAVAIGLALPPEESPR
jgi:hypothetical protein